MKKLISLLLALVTGLSLAVLPASALTLDEAKELLAIHYVDGVPPELLELDSLDAILEALGDPYTFYMTPEQYNAFNQSVDGQVVVGIGATVENIFSNGYRVMSVLPQSPALEAGLQAGDILTAVNGVDLTADTDPRTYIAGPEGTSVSISVLREGRRLDFTITRRAVAIPIVTYEERGSAGYIDCLSFGSSTAETFEEAIKAMDDHTQVWIVDLRTNPGGDSGATATSASHFTGGGIMLYFRDGAGNYNYTYTLPGFPDLTDKPVIVLTSEHSASGSELFAGDIRAYGAGITLGQRTFGKGTAQIVLNGDNCPYMKDGEAMKITAYRFFAPDGASNYITGVLPTLLISPENTENAAMLLSCPAPFRPENHLRLEIAGQTFYINLSEALKEENRPAFTELLEALPLSSRVLYSTGKNWDKCEPIAPAEVARELSLSAFTPRVFPDAQGSEFAREIDTLTTYRILSGFEDGTFRPEDTLTRAQFCAMIASALDLNTSAGKPAAFADVEEGAWYAGPVSAMAGMGFITGYDDGAFHPESTVTYQEMAAILNRAAAWVSMDGYALDREDLTMEQWGEYYDFAEWARAAARNLDELGALAGDLAPTDSGTREVAAAMLCRLMERTRLIWD